jgi:2-polyprenyl-3-methyl-5-hydroxy-6-metoxy-1,4-benzoquinol methylase
MGVTTETYDSYFSSRGVTADTYDQYVLPAHLLPLLPRTKSGPILDIGCGYCQTLKSLRQLGYTDLQGIDVSNDAIQHGQAEALDVALVEDLESFLHSSEARYDLVIMSHVIEHLNKERIVETLRLIRSRLLTPSGFLYLATPNAQAPTNCYWAYEDFTHTTIFTAGSILYVLRQAGYKTIEFLDPNGLEFLPAPKRMIKGLLQFLYRSNRRMWNRAMSSSYHRPSPEIYAWELRVQAR